MNNKQVIIDINELSYRYEKENVLEDINLSIQKVLFLVLSVRMDLVNQHY